MAHSLQAFLEIPVSTALDVSEDGASVLVAADHSGTAQLHVLPLGGGEPRQITDLGHPVSGRFLPGTGGAVLVSKDHRGDERHQLHLLRSPLGELEPVVVDDDHIHRLGDVSPDGRRIVYATNRRNGVDWDVVVRDLRDGTERVVFDRGGWCEAGRFSPDGRWVTVSRATELSLDNDIFLCGLETGEVIHVSPHRGDATFAEPAWLPDRSGLLVPNDAGRDTMVLSRWDMRTGRLSTALEVGWECACWIDPTGTRVLLAVNQDGATRMRILDVATLRQVAEVQLPHEGVAWRPGLLPPPRFAPDGRHLIFTFTSPREPGDVWVAPVDGGAPLRLTSSPRDVPAADCVMPERCGITSFDGETIPAFVYRPRSTGDASPPVVVLVHGGPESQTTLLWNPVIQALVARGYAVVAPNVRGSTGYGKRYCHLDDVRLRLDSVRDLAAIHGWLPRAGLDQGRAALWGGSYGGYMVLAGLAFQPELWRAGVDIVGISSLVTFLENTSAWRRSIREREYGRLDTDRDFLVEASPLTHVDAIRAPLFIIHGANDPRVPLSEAEQIRDVLRRKGVETELLVYGDEGHGLARRANRLDAYPRAFDFLDRVLRD